MLDFRHFVNLEVDGSPGVVIVARGEEALQQIEFVVWRGRENERGPVLGRVLWIVDFQNRSLRFELDQALASSAQAVCLAACLLGVAGSLADCLMRATTANDAWDCIDKNATASVM